MLAGWKENKIIVAKYLHNLKWKAGPYMQDLQKKKTNILEPYFENP